MDKNKIIIWGIIGIVIIIAAVAIYAAFAKTQTATSGGGSQTTHEGIFGFVKGWFDNLVIGVGK